MDQRVHRFALALVLTGERWLIEKEVLVSAPGCRRLARLAGHLAYWFGWFAFHPDTPVYQP
jgi:hypothetical protein